MINPEPKTFQKSIQELVPVFKKTDTTSRLIAFSFLCGMLSDLPDINEKPYSKPMVIKSLSERTRKLRQRLESMKVSRGLSKQWALEDKLFVSDQEISPLYLEALAFLLLAEIENVNRETFTQEIDARREVLQSTIAAVKKVATQNPNPHPAIGLQTAF